MKYMFKAARREASRLDIKLRSNEAFTIIHDISAEERKEEKRVIHSDFEYPFISA
jgi:hypothetical protein